MYLTCDSSNARDSNYVTSSEGSREVKKGDPQMKTLDIEYSESGTQNRNQLTLKTFSN